MSVDLNAGNWPHRAFIEDLKAFLEPCHRQYHENILNGAGNLWITSKDDSEAVRAGKAAPSSTLCRQTTFLTRMLLKKACGETWSVGGGFCLHARVRAPDMLKTEVWEDIRDSGKPVILPPGDWLVTPDGNLYGLHYWLEKDRAILDLTADQFGHESIVWTSSDDARYAKEPGRSKVGHITSTRSTALKWLHNDFGFWARANKYYAEINEAHARLLGKYPAVQALVQPDAELSR